jgi:DNA-binding CsgD family transcriptional regulator/tetratricopeptide (TPR) repeat protein
MDPSTAQALSPTGLAIFTTGRFEGENLERAIKIVERSLAICRCLPFRREASIRAFLPHLFALSGLLEQQGDYDGAEGLLAEALSLAREVDNTAAIGKALWDRGEIAKAKCNDQSARTLYREALPFRRQSRGGNGLAVDLTVLADLEAGIGEHTAAATLLGEALALGQELQDPWVSALAHMGLAQLAITQAESQEAINQYGHALDVFHQLDDPGGKAEILGGLAEVYRGIGDLTRAIELHDEQLGIWAELEYTREVAVSLCGKGLTHAALGDFVEAERLCKQALTIWEESGEFARCSLALCALADIARDRGAIERALSLYQQSIAASLTWTERRAVGTAVLCLANLEMEAGQIERAVRVLGILVPLRETTALYLSNSQVTEYERLRDMIGSRVGQATFAAVFDEGRALVDIARNHPCRADTYEAILAALEKPTQRTKQHFPNGLTGREFEVLKLLIQGKKNQEIADALYITPKTVSTHVTSILGKLGVTSRTEAAAYAHQHNLV